MATDTTVSNLIINKLTKAQYDQIQNPSDTELYLVPDVIDSAPTSGSTNCVESGGVYTALQDKLDAPSTAGTSGQVLTSDGQGGQSWQTPQSGGVTDVTVGGTSVVSSGVAAVPAIPTVPTISTDIASDATSDTKTTSPKAVKTFVENKGYGTYSKPSGGIPESDLSSDVQQALQKHFKGWYASSSALPANPIVGDYAYVKGANASDPAAIYECTTAGTWSDSGRTADTSNVQTFASGEEVNEVSIPDIEFSGMAKTYLLQLLNKVAYVDDDAKDTLSLLRVALFQDVSSISADFEQGQVEVYEYTELSSLKQYLTVTALLNDGSSMVLPANAYELSGTLTEGTSTITATYDDKSDTFTVLVSATPREVLFGVFTDGYAVQKGLSDGIQKVFRFAYSSRACIHDPVENRGYVFTVTDSSKYNIAVNDVLNNEKQTEGAPQGTADGYYYAGGTKSISWKTQDSASTPYIWISLKKLDNTAFTAEELADGAAAVFNYTKGN